MLSFNLITSFSNVDMHSVIVIKSHSQDVSWLNQSLYIIVRFHGYDNTLSLVEYILEYHLMRHDLVIASKVLIQLVHNNNYLVETFICSWLSSYIVIDIFDIFFLNEKSHISAIWCIIDLKHTHALLASWRFLHDLKKWLPALSLLIAKILLCLHM